MKLLIMLSACWATILPHAAVADMASNLVSAINSSNAALIADAFVVESDITEDQAKIFIGKIQAIYGPLALATNEVRSGVIRRSVSLGKEHRGPIAKQEIAIICPKMHDAALIVDLPIGKDRISLLEISGRVK